jgi:hypothetical protein
MADKILFSGNDEELDPLFSTLFSDQISAIKSDLSRAKK